MLEVIKINTFYGTNHILFDVSMRVEKGEVVCHLGRNGAGKTTTIRSIMGLTPPRSGIIKFKGEDITNLRPFKIARKGIGYVPSGRRIFPNLTVKENLEIAYKRGGLGDKWNLDRVFELFPKLKELSGRKGGTLSGGEQQMLAIGRALMGNPEFLLLDEPAEGLSPIIVGYLEDQILKLKEEGITMLICEQNINFALRVSDRGYILEKGAIKFEGDIGVISSDEEIKSYLAL